MVKIISALTVFCALVRQSETQLTQCSKQSLAEFAPQMSYKTWLKVRDDTGFMRVKSRQIRRLN